jgi:hypothetical protein
LFGAQAHEGGKPKAGPSFVFCTQEIARIQQIKLAQHDPIFSKGPARRGDLTRLRAIFFSSTNQAIEALHSLTKEQVFQRMLQKNDQGAEGKKGKQTRLQETDIRRSTFSPKVHFSFLLHTVVLRIESPFPSGVSSTLQRFAGKPEPEAAPALAAATAC